MKLDLAGKIRNTQLPKTRPLLPLFEAVVNSFQALEDSADVTNPCIHITALREATLPDMPVGVIEGFKIEDNGIGFDSSNFESFFTVRLIAQIESGRSGHRTIHLAQSFRSG